MNHTIRSGLARRTLLGIAVLTVFPAAILAAGILPQGAPPLIQACAGGELPKVQQLVAQGASVNQTDENGATALMWAAKSGNLDLVKFLISKGVDPKKKGIIWQDEKKTSWAGGVIGAAAWQTHWDVVWYLIRECGLGVDEREVDREGKETGWTALMYAAYQGNVQQVGNLLTAGADVRMMDGAGHSTLFMASRNGSVEVIQALFKAGADLKALDDEGRSVLFAAAFSGRTEAVGLLLKAGLSPNGRAKDGRSPLMAAATGGTPETVQALLKAGADVKAKDKDGWTALHYAAGNQSAAIGALLKSGADVNAASYDENRRVTPLMVACWHNSKDPLASVNALLAAPVDVKAKDKDGWTALHYAARHHRGAIALLLAAGADANAKDAGGFTALHTASRYGNAEAIPFLLKAGASPDERLDDGRAPLMLAANGKGRSAETVRALLNGGAGRLSACDETGATALHLAAMCGRRELVDILMAAGAEARAKDTCGWTPLHFAALSGSAGTVQSLVNGNADVNALDLTGFTPLMAAVCSGSKEACALLIERGAKATKDNAGRGPYWFATRNNQREISALLAAKRMDGGRSARPEVDSSVYRAVLETLRGACEECVEVRFVVDSLLGGGCGPSMILDALDQSVGLARASYYAKRMLADPRTRSESQIWLDKER